MDCFQKLLAPYMITVKDDLHIKMFNTLSEVRWYSEFHRIKGNKNTERMLSLIRWVWRPSHD